VAHERLPVDHNGGLEQGRLSLRGTRVVAFGGDEVVLKRGLAEVRLSFPGVALLVDRVTELADGTRDEHSIIASFEPDLQPQVRRLVTGIRARGILHQLPTADPSDLFWLSVAPFAPDGPAAVANARAVVVGVGAVAESTASALSACGVGEVVVRDAPPPLGEWWDVWCVAADEVLDGNELLPVVEAALRAGVVCLPAWLDELVARVGPMTYPYDTACLQCYLLRVDSNDPERELHRQLRTQRGDNHSGAGFLPPAASIAGQVAAVEIVKQLAGLPVTSVGRVIELSLVPFRCDVRRVLRVPRCLLCSGVAAQGAPVVAHASQLTQ
jgi:bacteriocin biosynthesis cyclodehydratase domain-containing protein